MNRFIRILLSTSYIVLDDDVFIELNICYIMNDELIIHHGVKFTVTLKWIITISHVQKMCLDEADSIITWCVIFWSPLGFVWK